MEGAIERWRLYTEINKSSIAVTHIAKDKGWFEAVMPLQDFQLETTGKSSLQKLHLPVRKSGAEKLAHLSI